MDFYLDDETRMKWDAMISGEGEVVGARGGSEGGEYKGVSGGGLGFQQQAAGNARNGSPLLPRSCSLQPARPRRRRAELRAAPLPTPPPAAETHLLESGEQGGRCQVVRWLRTFPFAFISQREYVIARRFFRDQVRAAA